ncbi:MAG: PAS domain S-box protein [Sulfuritalea sp.]|nr:PAS domain S-box protein [Sulfuritalea sp.]
MKPDPSRLSRDPIVIPTVVLGYATLGALWVLASDQVVEWLFRDPGAMAIASTVKGWAFIAVTSVLLYATLRSRLGVANGADGIPAAVPAQPRRSLRLPMILASVAIVGATAAVIRYNVAGHKATEAARLQAVADIKTRQIAGWLEERQGDVAFLEAGRPLAEYYRDWRERGNGASRDRLLERLDQFRVAKGYQRLALLDEQGELLWNSAGETNAVTPGLRDEAHRAVASGTGFLLRSIESADGDAPFNFVAHLAVSGGRPSPALILSMDRAGYVASLLQTWPVPSLSAETLLFRRDGDQVLFLNRLRHRTDTVGLRAPVAERKLLAAQVLRGEAGPGSVIEGVDYRGVPVLGAARAILGTDWFLIAKVDRAEAFAEATRDSVWTALAGLLLLFAATGGAIMVHQRRNLAEAGHINAIQSEKLRALEMLDALARGTDDAMFVKDAQGRYLLFNRAACELFGKAEQEVLGKNCWALFPAGEAATVAASDQEVMANRRLDTSELCLTLARGPVTLQVTRGPLLDANGELQGVFGIARDITESKRAAESLRTLSMAVEQSPESIVITDTEARIEYVNEAFVRNTGFSREEALGKNPRILQSGRTPRETFQAMWAALSEGKIWKGVLFNRRKDGSEYVEFVIITPIHEADGRVSHYVAVKEDITEKKRLGAELDRHRHHLEELVASRTAELEQARQQADAANRAKSAFLANMSHEIRTPMNAIVGLTYMLHRARPTPEQADKLDKIAVAAAHLLSIVNDILDLSKIEAGKMELEQTDFSLATILDHTRSLIAEQALAKGLAVSVEADGVPLWLRGDPTRLRQAFLNFAANAVKFTERGAITLRARLLEDHGKQMRIRFEVEDTGVGIAADTLALLFQPFTQADVSTTRRHGGTGLGLVISRRLVELMGGETGVESEVGRGSTFWFSVRLERGRGVLPAEPDASGSADTADAADAELRRHHGGARILLVEDNAVNREVALELIHAAGINADTAADGREAVAMASATAYDLILMDMQMPRMNGPDATRAIRALPGGAAVPILAMTANAMDEDRRACLDAGMNDFVSKPVDPPQFYAMLLRWLPPTPVESLLTAVAPEAAGAPSVDDAELLRRLAGIAGLDVDYGLLLTRGNVKKYARLLVMFVVGHEQYAAQILAMLAAGDLAAIRSIAHSVKGSAGMVGARDVSGSASPVLSALDSGAGPGEVGPLCSVLAEKLSGLVDKIRQATAEIEASAAIEASARIVAPASARADSPRAAAVLARLADLLDEGNMEANFLARNEAGLLHAALGKSATSLLARIEAFDHENAATEVREILAGFRRERSALSAPADTEVLP